MPELFSAILTRARSRRPRAAALRATIECCLEKEQDRRYPDAAAVRTALEAIAAGTVAPWVEWRYHIQRLAITVAQAHVLLRGQ